MVQNPQDQNALMMLESFWKLLDSKLISLGVPGALIIVILAKARKKLIPRIEQSFDKLLDCPVTR